MAGEFSFRSEEKEVQAVLPVRFQSLSRRLEYSWLRSSLGTRGPTPKQIAGNIAHRSLAIDSTGDCKWPRSTARYHQTSKTRRHCGPFQVIPVFAAFFRSRILPDCIRKDARGL